MTFAKWYIYIYICICIYVYKNSVNICIYVDLQTCVNVLASIATRYSSSVAVAFSELLKLIFALAMLPPKAEIHWASSNFVLVGS